jgi:hypothetical protein
MGTRMIPEVGHWYAHRDKGQMFQVVAFDADDGCVEIQDFDGDVDEVDMDTWFAMPLDPAEAPEDWTGPVDDIEPDDLGYASGTEMETRGWHVPLDELPATVQQAAEDDEADDESSASVH